MAGFFCYGCEAQTFHNDLNPGFIFNITFRGIVSLFTGIHHLFQQ